MRSVGLSLETFSPTWAQVFLLAIYFITIYKYFFKKIHKTDSYPEVRSFVLFGNLKLASQDSCGPMGVLLIGESREKRPPPDTDKEWELLVLLCCNAACQPVRLQQWN